MPKKSARKPRKPIPAPLQRCVTSVAPKMKAQGRGVGAAFAICTSQLQKSGVLKPGTRTVTHRGAGVISGIARRGEYRSTMREFERAITRKNGADWVEPPVVASTTYKVSPSERGTVGWSEVRVDMRVGRHVIDFDVFHDGRQSGFLASYGELRRTLRYDDVAERHTDRIMAQVDRMIASYPGVVRRDIPGLSGYHGHYFPRKNGSSLTRSNGHSEAEQIEEIVRLGTSPLKRDRTAYEKAVTRLWNRPGDDAVSYNPAGGEADDVDLHDLYDATELPRVPRVGRVAVVRHRQGSTLEVGRRKYYWRWYILLRSY